MQVESDRGKITALPVHAGLIAFDVNFSEPAHVYVGGVGTVSVVTAGGETIDFAMQTGSIVPVQVIQVKSIGTTATNLRRIW